MAASGFTLVEILAVLVMLGILCVVGLVRYQGLLDDSRREAAASLLASAQSQLSLEYARRLLDNQNMNEPSQNVCDALAVGTAAGETVRLTCQGALVSNVAMTANVEGVTLEATWTNPVGN